MVSPGAKPGGAERAFLTVATHLPAAGVDVVAVLLEDGELAQWLRAAGVEPIVLHAGRTRNVPRALRVVGRIARIVREARADVVLSTMAKGHVYGGLAALRARVPAVLWQQSLPGRSRLDRAAARVPAAAAVCVSDASAAAQRRLTPRLRTVTVHLGVPLDDIRARAGAGAAIRRELGWNGSRVVGIVGRLEPWKGQDTFLRAAAVVSRAVPNVRFAVVGGAILGWEGSYPDDLVRLAEELGVADCVHFAGHQSDPWAWMDAMDVVVHSSVAEPFGLVVVEAMALGKPLVAAAEGGPLEIARDGESALLIPPRNPAALATAVRSLLEDDELRGRVAAGARARAEYFSEAKTAEAIARVFAEVVRG